MTHYVNGSWKEFVAALPPLPYSAALVVISTKTMMANNLMMALLDGNLIAKAGSGESKVFYQKMKADYYRYLAEFAKDDVKKANATQADTAYKAATESSNQLAPTHPIRLGLALGFLGLLCLSLGRRGGSGMAATRQCCS